MIKGKQDNTEGGNKGQDGKVKFHLSPQDRRQSEVLTFSLSDYHGNVTTLYINHHSRNMDKSGNIRSSGRHIYLGNNIYYIESNDKVGFPNPTSPLY